MADTSSPNPAATPSPSASSAPPAPSTAAPPGPRTLTATPGAAPLDETVVLVLPVIWTYEGTGRPLAADAELALAAAARARAHHGHADNAA